MDKRANLTPAQRALLEKRIKGQAGPLIASAAAKKTGIPRRPEGQVPLSYAQERIWIMEQLEEDSVTYNIPLSVTIMGDLDFDIFTRSINVVIARHEALRTTFHTKEGKPNIAIKDELILSVHREDIRHLPEAERKAEADRLATAEARRPFDLSAGPLVRATLIRKTDTEHLFVLIMHHIIGDGWSIGILVSEFTAVYDAFAQGKQSPLPELPIQYSDFAHWQKSPEQQQALDRHLAYWKNQLSGSLEPLALPTDRPRTAQQTFNGVMTNFLLSKSLSEDLKNLALQEGTSLFMTLTAAFQTFLARYAGQTDILIGSPIANRNRQEVEGLVGVFINTLVLRSQVEKGMSFRTLLQNVRKTTLEAFAHQDLPFEKLVEELQPNRNMTYSPLFQVMFILQNTPSSLAMHSLTLHPEPIDPGTSMFDITLMFYDTERGLSGEWQYNSDLFDAETVARMIGHFTTMLQAIVDNPDQLLHALPLLPQEEQQKILSDWNQTNEVSFDSTCLNHVFEAQVERTPDAVAVVFEDQELTFSALNNRANHVAEQLLALGISPDDRVGIHLERSLDMVTALLATQKAGGCYVPLDPSYPQERLGYMIKDSMPKVILTQASLADKLPAQEAQVIVLAGAEPSVALPNPNSLVRPEHLAYMIYTSGSTGQPKGVLVEHRNAVHTFEAMDKAVGCQPGDAILSVTSIGFDISVVELFWTMSRGGKVILLSDQDILEAGVSDSEYSLRSQLHRHGATILQCTPSMMGMITAMPEGLAALHPLKKIMLGGEALPLALARQLKGHTNARLFNLYGPTETTIYSTAYEVTDTSLITIPLGRPIDNYTIYILDEYLQPVPVGVGGEMHIGGPGLTRGYHGRPDLTAERFIPNPFGPGRLYKTGDLATYLSDGTIKYLGRLDHQVKVRGYRIELGEIETRLSQHDEIRESVVVAHDNTLVAYVVTEGDVMPTVQELRTALREHLPDYMVPSAYVRLEAMPLTPSGKVDRKALPAPQSAAFSSEQSYVPPSTPLELALTSIWKDILSVEEVSIQDNFFTLGGHSLLATQLVSRVITDLKVKFTLRDVFSNPTVRDMAHYLQHQSAVVNDRQFAPILPGTRERERPASYAQERLWFLDQLQPNQATYNMAASLRLQGALDTEALVRSFEMIVQRHESLRTTFDSVDGSVKQIIATVVDVNLPIQNVASETEARACALEEAQTPFDLRQGPLLRAKLLRLGSEDHLLLLTLHHIITDEWSMGILVNEMVSLYGELAAGNVVTLPELVIQYADYAAWQKEWLQGDVLQEQLGYWKQQLGGDLPILELPTDFSRPAVLSDNGANLVFQLDADLTDRLKKLSQQEGATLYMTLLAAFNTLLHRYTGQDDILIGSPIAGRSREEVEGLIGFFVNTLVLRTDLSGRPTFRDLLSRVRQSALDAYAHQDVPFERLVGELQPKRQMSYSPLFQVLFALQNAPKGTLEVQGLTLTPEPQENSKAKFDLSLDMVEEADGLRGVLEYNTDLFAPATISRMAEHFVTLLTSIAARPNSLLNELRLLTDVEERQLLDWTQIKAPTQQVQCFHHLFEAQVERTPEAEAVVCGEARLTYRELNERANQLAHYLQGQGVTEETLVALCVDRTPLMVISALAVLKAGGAYVPIDPTYPVDRIESMLSVCAPPLLLTDQKVELSGAHEATRVLAWEEVVSDIAAQPTRNPISRVEPHNLAYVIFTSGSTGVPKGVMVQHDTLHSTSEVWYGKFGFDKMNVRGLQYASMSFDVFVGDLIRSLLTGGALVICPYEVRLDFTALHRLMQDEKVTVIDSTPGLIIPLMDYIWQNNLPLDHLKVVLPGADALASTDYATLLERFGDRMIIANCYGITETTIDSSTFEAEAGQFDPHLYSTVPIGRPNDNARMYILDAHLNPQPIGIAGELYIGGSCVARGYYNRPDLTAERFLANPFVPGERFYKTGDAARWLPDGNVQFLGRLDQQVKLRGYRVELGEIEAVLADHPSISKAVVNIMGQDLAAYYSGQEVAAAELRAYLKTRLPAYLVPAYFMHLDSLPLSPNGKIDRRLLPAPEGAERTDAYVAPRNSTEERLAVIWSELLLVEQISVHDNFFDIGGHSLMATQLVVKVQKEFQVTLQLRDLFEKTTIAELAEAVEAAEKVETPVYKRLDRVGSRKKR
ncbi:hypothetical protein CIG75_11045 [Tumebacillus algifaecis]|uniref:Carrier domain-containing protein n=1 Tax=Tumebacillus algifaecis TaxID=1214604 RepID=A0A223D126_9BACL|nr:non-ribosomal peptide synthetase [Tumebacillus algifaecis]ASS75459.1 hypothetical protein CIG75_11045 [Tumebacillus algifaecis]